MAIQAPERESWEFAGWGRADRIVDLGDGTAPGSRPISEVAAQLGPWRSTAICGNDISSSVLYVSALSASHAGVYAPLSLLLVAGVLYLFRTIYAEVGSALRLNGGTYTVLLNTTNKKVAAAAACLTLLSYMATAVISAGEAMHYAANLAPGLDVMSATIALLAGFALLNLIGIAESAVVALVIFLLHLLTLVVLSVAGAVRIAGDPSLLVANWSLPPTHGLGASLFLGFSAAMLGISGFESSANFIEEQKPGVFPITLRNMWLVVLIFNPLISLLSLGLLPLAEIERVPPDLLALMGHRSLGELLRSWVSIDAVLVLSGAVLTSYVGVTGLVRRMSLDRCLPQFLLSQNQWRRTNHWIILGFFALCVSILVVTGGHLERLAGVYTLSFLSVMALFAVGDMLLKRTRARLPRIVRASWPAVVVALVAMLVAIAGNIVLDPENVKVFAVYTLIAVSVVAGMFLRVQILKVVLFVIRGAMDRVVSINEWIRSAVRSRIEEINSRAVVYFSKGDDVAVLNRAALYVLENEQTNNLKVVRVYDQETELPPELAQALSTIDHLYPQLRIDFLAVRGRFGPDLIAQLSERLQIPRNAMFIGTPGDRFPYRVAELGGVRVIL
ncbi:MAG: APC family permease [Deltaproteobacteria bacterium]|nr:APC family permease [Deltaproteobacteria bacterium]